MSTVIVSQSQLLDVLRSIVSSMFVHLVTETKVRMNKKNNPYFDRVRKQSSCTYLVGNSYEDRTTVNNEKEGIDPSQFQVQENKVGIHISTCVLYNEKLNKYYFQVERFDEIRPKVTYVMDGNSIEKTLFESYLVQHSNYENQTSDRKVKYISFGLDSIKECTINKVKYIVQ